MHWTARLEFSNGPMPLVMLYILHHQSEVMALDARTSNCSHSTANGPTQPPSYQRRQSQSDGSVYFGNLDNRICGERSGIGK